MWTRSLLKANARAALAGRYWRSVGLCLLLALLGIGYSAPVLTTQFRTQSAFSSMTSEPVWQGNGTGYAGSMSAADETVLTALMRVFGLAAVAIVLILIALALCWDIFLINPLVVGRNRYFMESRQSPTPFSTVTTIFGPGFLNAAKVMFLKKLKILLGCLLILPGIYWHFCYLQVPYLLAENPYLTTERAMTLSKQMMQGEKWNTFLLHLSFLGWQLLCALSFGLGYIFLEPYIQATNAELYAALRAKALAARWSDGYELGGFVRHEA